MVMRLNLAAKTKDAKSDPDETDKQDKKRPAQVAGTIHISADMEETR